MPKTEKKQRRSFGSYFTNNLLLKLLSLVVAVILWSFVISQTNPVRTKTLTDIPVAVTGLEELKDAGYIIRDSDAADALRVTVRVNASHSDYRFVDKNTVSASIDLSQAVKEGAAVLPVLVTLANVGDVSLVSVSPSTVSLAIDTLAVKDVPVRLETTGTLADGLVSLTPSYPEKITISGAGYYVERIASAVLDVDLSSLSDGSSVTALCRFTDDKNNAIKFPGVRITADMDVLTVKEVPVDAEDAFTGQVAEGFRLSHVSAEKVKICGHKNVIESLTVLKPDAIDLTGCSASFTAPLTFTLPEGVYLAPDQGEATAQIEITEEQQTVSLSRPVIVSGLGTHTATLSDGKTTVNLKADGVTAIRASVTITGPRSLLDSIGEDDVIVRLTLDEKEPGSYELTPFVVLNTALASGVTAQITAPARLYVVIQ